MNRFNNITLFLISKYIAAGFLAYTIYNIYLPSTYFFNNVNCFEDSLFLSLKFITTSISGLK